MKKKKPDEVCASIHVCVCVVCVCMYAGMQVLITVSDN